MPDTESLVLPNVVLAGVRKCGTTSVFKWLSAHPDVCSSAAKGTEFLMDRGGSLFNSEWNYHDQGLRGYERYFAGCAHQKVRLDATTRYFNQETARTVLAALNPQPHVLFVLRDPAERLNSLLRYERDNRRRILPQTTLDDFVRCIASGRPEELVVRDDPGRTQHDIDRWCQELMEEFENGRYVRYLSEWKARLSPERLHVYLFEEMKRDARAFMRRMAEDVGIDPGFYDQYSLSIHNPSIRLRSQAVHKLVRHLKSVVPKSRLTKMLRRTYLWLQDSGRDRAETVDLAAVRELYRPDTERLAREFGLDLSSWYDQKDTAAAQQAGSRRGDAC